MLWELAPEDVIGKTGVLNCAKIEREWKSRKNNMEKASRRSWTANEISPRAMQLREHTVKEFLEIFVDDRHFGADAFFRHGRVLLRNDDNGQDPGMGGRRKMGGIQICHVHVDLHQKSIDKKRNIKSSNGGVFEEANVVHYARTGSVLEHS